MKRYKPRAAWDNPLGLKPKFPFKLKKWSWRRFWRTLAGLAGVFALTVVLLFAWYAKDLPTPGKIKKRKPAEATQILDRDGNPLYAVFGEEKRISIAFDEIPEHVKEATVAIEDKHFYEHHGFDVRGLVRGVILKPLTGQRAQGGSTITQQYVKNALLTPERSIDRKIKELILSLELEAMFNKDDILGFYLNEIPYGSNAYGIEAAAETYFNTQAKDLTLAQSAALAALPQRPSYFSPYGTHLDELLARKDFILKLMHEQGFITAEERDAAQAEELTFVPRREQISAPHFVFYIRDLLVEKYGERLVLEGGLKVTTSLDPKAQEAAEQAVTKAAEKHLAGYKADNAAVVAIDPRNGQVLAMVGSVDYFDQENQGNFNVTTAPRQPGSSFKPIAYATAFKGKWSPSSTLWDVPTDFGKYKPQNYDGSFRGPVTARAALANSLNIPAVKMLALAGIDETIETAQDLGITSLTERDRYGLSLVLGGADVPPIEMATAYGVFAAQGTYHPTNPILKVTDNRGRVLEEWKEDKKEVLAPEVAYEITHILIDNEARTPVFGARSPLYFPERPVAAKTGTTQEYRDGWTVGYTPSVSAAVWVGNNDYSPMNAAGGVRAAGPIFHDFMTGYLKGTPAEPFPRPEEITEFTVDALSGKKPTKHSPQTITDIFAPWQIPSESDDIHVAVQINKENGKLATETTPEHLIETKIYTRIHSERPKDPNWEEPVIKWAIDHGFAIGDPPTEKDGTPPDQLPTIRFSSPPAGSVINGPFEIVAVPESPHGIKTVYFYVDGVLVGTREEEPWFVRYDASKLAQGNHEMVIEIVDKSGRKAQSSQLFIVARDETPPGPVSDASAQTQGASGNIKLSWKNPSDNDLSKIRIYRSTTPGQLGPLVEVVTSSPSTVQSVTIAGHATGQLYYFSLRPVDTNNNEGRSSNQLVAL